MSFTRIREREYGEVELTRYRNIHAERMATSVFISIRVRLPNAIKSSREFWLVGAYMIQLEGVVGRIRSKIVMVDCRSLLGSVSLPLWLGCDISAANVVKLDGSVPCQPGAYNK